MKTGKEAPQSMNTKQRKKIGVILLICGIVLLFFSILIAFSMGTVAVPILLVLSILVNTAGVSALRRRD